MVISTCNISTWEGATELFDICEEFGPIGGIFHLAMVLNDTLFENQTVENFKISAETKLWGTKNLDQLSRKRCRDTLQW